MPRKSRSKIQINPEIGARRAARARRNTMLFGGGAAVVIALLAFLIIRQMPESVEGEQKIADQGFGTQRHLADENVPHAAYNSNPPTSGFHHGSATAPWGVKTEFVADEISLHNLEHGGIAFHYRQDLDADSVRKLQSLVGEIQAKNKCIVLIPRPVDKLAVPVAATAWNYLLELQSVDEDRLRRFFQAHVGRGPEQIDCAQWKD